MRELAPGSRPIKQSVQNRTPFLLRFCVALPSVEARGRWRERGRMGRRFRAEGTSHLRRLSPASAEVDGGRTPKPANLIPHATGLLRRVTGHHLRRTLRPNVDAVVSIDVLYTTITAPRTSSSVALAGRLPVIATSIRRGLATRLTPDVGALSRA